jgi:hypothetical protein
MSVRVKTVEARGVSGIAVAAPARRRMERIDFETAAIVAKVTLLVK